MLSHNSYAFEICPNHLEGGGEEAMSCESRMRSRSEKEQSNAGYAFCQMKSALWTQRVGASSIPRRCVYPESRYSHDPEERQRAAACAAPASACVRARLSYFLSRVIETSKASRDICLGLCAVNYILIAPSSEKHLAESLPRLSRKCFPFRAARIPREDPLKIHRSDHRRELLVNAKSDAPSKCVRE